MDRDDAMAWTLARIYTNLIKAKGGEEFCKPVRICIQQIFGLYAEWRAILYDIFSCRRPMHEPRLRERDEPW